jgi:hypothetical protein
MPDRDNGIDDLKREIKRITHRLDHTLGPWEDEYVQLSETRDRLETELRFLASGVEPPSEGDPQSFLEAARGTAASVRDHRMAAYKAEENQTLERVSSELEGFARRLRDAIMADARGKSSFLGPTGSVSLGLVDEAGKPILFLWIDREKVMTTHGFLLLQAQCAELGARLDVEDEDLALYSEGIDDLAPTCCHFTVRVSGW